MSQLTPEFQMIVALLAVVNELQEQVTVLSQQGAKLEAENKELSARLNTNSRNSSKPPSSDGYAKPNAKAKDSLEATESDPKDEKPNPKSLRKKSGRKPGGQKGHKGSTLRQAAKAEHTHYHPVIDCEKCGCSLRSEKTVKLVERQVFEPGRFGHFEVTAHVAEVKKCSCGHVTQASFPEGVDSHVQYGPVTQALAVYLCQYQLVPYKRASQFFMDIFGLEVSPGSICTFQEKAYNQLASTEQAIADALKVEPIAGADETGMRVAGALWWMHVLRTEKWTMYHLDPSRGHSAIESMGILLAFAGILVHDHYKAYFRYAALHALCNAHHLRELQGVVDRDCNHLAARLQRLLRLACHLSNGFRKIGMKAMPEVIYQRIASLFERTARRALAEEAEYMERVRQRLGRDKVKNTKAFNLFKRLVEFKDETLRFMTDLNIPFDNNGSERDIRNGKVKQKISGCIRSKKGAKWYCRIRSYVSSARKQGQNVFEALLIAMKNYCGHPLLGAE
ncbi:IS66 family transposase [Endozoicomonas sp. 4G]|uniref:IS66 family transposase n=1 Tax=Endozoicomonas sp. 4G TaxID=2872754 RepID=UPI0020784C93|nr:IS66 family transposase [Endozoicomonas sp. 4G]